MGAKQENCQWPGVIKGDIETRSNLGFHKTFSLMLQLFCAACCMSCFVQQLQTRRCPLTWFIRYALAEPIRHCNNAVQYGSLYPTLPVTDCLIDLSFSSDSRRDAEFLEQCESYLWHLCGLCAAETVAVPETVMYQQSTQLLGEMQHVLLCPAALHVTCEVGWFDDTVEMSMSTSENGVAGFVATCIEPGSTAMVLPSKTS